MGMAQSIRRQNECLSYEKGNDVVLEDGFVLIMNSVADDVEEMRESGSTVFQMSNNNYAE